MGFMNTVLYSEEKNKVYLIGLLHFAMVCFGVWSLIKEMINLEEPVTPYEATYIGVHYIIHFMLIFGLFIGVYIDIPFFLYPWLGGTLLVYTYLTILTITSVKSTTKNNFLFYSLNYIYLAIYWYTWYVVFSYIKAALKRGRMCLDKSLLE